MLRAILFDFNGVIADDEAFHFRAFQQVLEEEKIPFSEAVYNNVYIGFDDKGAFTHIFQHHGKALSDLELQQLIQRKSRYYDEMVKQQIAFFPGVKTFIQKVSKKYLTAIVSGALRKEVDTILLTAKLKDYFKVIITAEDVMAGKPSPEGYRLAVKRLNEWLSVQGSDPPLEPAECLVIEDTLAGIQSASRAGIKCLALPHSYPIEKLYEPADFVAASFNEIDLKAIEETYW